jgi:flavin reductase (DIM6/NTAB) family NADH-FMN oxidoreductase RutF
VSAAREPPQDAAGRREGVARLTRVARVAAQPEGGGGLMPPLRVGHRPADRAAPAPAPGHLPAPTGVATLTPKAAAVERAARELRLVMGRFATGVTVITTLAGDTVHGMTANGVLSVSLRPPLVLVSLGRCRMNELLPRTGHYAISVLAHDQEHLAAHFAGQREAPSAPQFRFDGGLPVVDGALAHLVCRVVDVHRSGDHVLWIGEVQRAHHREGQPLLFYTGRFGTFGGTAERG